MIMIGRVIYGLADQGNLPKVLARLNSVTTPVLATAIGVGAILMLALTARFTHVIFATVNLALIRIKNRNDMAPLDAFICPRRAPLAGLVSSVLLLVVDLIV